MRFPKATIDASALRHNLAAVRRFAPASKVMAIIKANAYGHGLVGVAQALSSADGQEPEPGGRRSAAAADAFGVARLEEGLALCEAGFAAPIVLLEGVFNSTELTRARRAAMQIVVHNVEQIELLDRSGFARELELWCKVDTGMNRLGFRVEEFPAVWARVRQLAPKQLRLMTHLAASEIADGPMTAEQLARFEALQTDPGIERSIANSAGLIQSAQARADWVRPGLMLYGISPIPNVTAAELGLRPAMTLATQLIAVRTVPAGETVGYNGMWRAPRDAVIGIAAVGYGDGYLRNMRSGAPVLVNGQETQVVGRVSMDMTAIDVTGLEVRVGDRVTLWGEGLPIERVAPFADAIPYELVCGISQRVALEWAAPGSLRS